MEYWILIGCSATCHAQQPIKIQYSMKSYYNSKVTIILSFMQRAPGLLKRSVFSQPQTSSHCRCPRTLIPLYGVKTKNNSEARDAIFDRKLMREQKLTDIALLPPCRQTLQLLKFRAHFIDREWRSAGIKDYEGTDACDNGWNEEMELKWMETMMPEDVQELFIDHVDNECGDFSECSDPSDCED